MSTDEAQDWSGLPADVVDKIADAVKRRRRWPYDGPSLRILNRHWCQCISDNVHEIRPGVDRALSVGDVKALPKFSGATEVDATFFLQPCVCDNDTLARHLAAMPSLKRLIINGPQCSSFLQSGCLTLLTRLKESMHGDLHHPSGGVDRRRSVPLEELNIAPYSTTPRILGILRSVPALKKLSLECVDELAAEDVVYFNSLESVSLLLPYHSAELLPFITTLTSVTVGMCPGLIATLAAVKSLESISIHLCFRVWNAALTSSIDLTLLATLERLREINVTNETSDGRKCSLFIGAPLDRVETILLRLSRVHGSQMKQNLPSLKRVRLQSCIVCEVDAFFASLKNVEELSVRGVLGFDRLCDERARSISWSHDRLPRLKSLCLPVPRIENKSAATLFSLTRLEELSLHCIGRQTEDLIDVWLDQIRKLKQLRTLTMRGIRNAESRLDAEFVSNLDVFRWSAA